MLNILVFPLGPENYLAKMILHTQHLQGGFLILQGKLIENEEVRSFSPKRRYLLPIRRDNLFLHFFLGSEGYTLIYLCHSIMGPADPSSQTTGALNARFQTSHEKVMY